MRSRVRDSLVREGVRANVLAGVVPSDAAIVDAAARGDQGLPHASKAVLISPRPPRPQFLPFHARTERWVFRAQRQQSVLILRQIHQT
ncbi:MAG: hypothetical protein M3461_15170 [Pseudomonadota bacterium]|nr:hypothetical protein [Pseudomonadota bacterium]